MKRLRAISLMLVVLLSALLFPNLSVVQGETKNVGYFLKSTVRYSNPSPDRVWSFTEREEDRTISLFMNNAWQTVVLVNSTFSIEKTKNDNDGNPVAVLRFPQPVLNSGENVSFTVWYHIVSKPRIMPSISENESFSLTDIPTNLVDEYTGEEGPWQTRNPSLQELALSLKGSETKVLTIIKNFIAWIKENIHYPSLQSRHENPYYPNETYTRGEGDCDDQAILLVTLSRIVGIPSYLQIGSIYLPNQFDNASFWDGHVSMVERRIGWHGWAFVYIQPWGWLPVDLTYVRNNADDPLSSIRSGAVTGQDTIQYMNVTHTDYVASSLEARAFLSENGFNVFAEDEMTLGVDQKLPTTTTVDPWVPLVFMALMVFFVATSFLIFRRWTRGTIRKDTISQ